MRELIGVVPLVLVHDCDSVSDEMVHTVMAWTRTHSGDSKRVDYFFNDSFAQSMIIFEAIV